jgi:outer membrane receptor protein involved in Fe transport
MDDHRSRMNHGLDFILHLLLVAIVFPPPLAAQTTSDGDQIGAGGELEEITAFGRNIEFLGSASSASEGTVSGADFLVRPMLRVAELLEVVPGMVAVQHSGSGKASQYFLRGFNLDHGTDFVTYVDGMPWNLRSHGHGQGYLDVNGLLPEIVERIEYRKGTYRADVGDFSLTAASFIHTIDALNSPFVSLEGGQNGWGRVASGGSTPVGEGVLTAIGEYKSYDGPWERREGLKHVSIWGKYAVPLNFGELSIALSGYEGDWHPTEQIPERVIGSPVCEDVFCTLDPTAGGNTSRWIATAQMTGLDWDASAYVQFYDWNMQSNPTYDFQINQFDKRTTVGGRFDSSLVEVADLQLDIGAELRYDDIGPVGLDENDGGAFIANISNNDIRETSVGVYGEATWIPTDNLRVLAGLRSDYYDFNVTARGPGSTAGSKSDNILSPKVGLAYTVNNNVVLYGNWGEGFHSNDARGVVKAINSVPGLSPGTGYEVGARFELENLKLTVAHWWLELDSELLFVGDSNSVEPKGASERQGYELTAFWQPLGWLGVDATFTDSQARFVSNPEGQFIDGSLENTGQLGVSTTKGNWEASLRVRYLGSYALTPDNSQRAKSQTGVNVRGAYDFGQLTIYAELFNLLNNDGKDIVYYYGAHVEGFDPPGLTADDIDCDVVNCRMSRVSEPRTFRFGLKWEF